MSTTIIGADSAGDGLAESRNNGGMVKKSMNLLYGQRLRLFREAAGFDGRGGAARFARETGIGPKLLSQYESGTSRVPPEYINAPDTSKLGLTVAWIYNERIETLPEWIAQKIRARRTKK